MKFVNEIVGAEELKGILNELAPREANNLMRRATYDMAKDLREDVRAGAPEKTGTLKKAITASRKRGTPGSIEAAVEITKGKSARNDAWYWHFVEFGTRLRAAKPFIIPAAERMRSRLKEIFEEKFGKQLEKTLAKR